MEKAVYCTHCGTVGLQRFTRKGSASLGFFLLLLFIVPGVIYFLWHRFEGHWCCSTCGARDVVALEIPLAQGVLSAKSLEPEQIHALEAGLSLREPGQLDVRGGYSLLAR